MCLSQLLLHVVYFSFYVTSNKTITVRTVEEQEDILYDYKVELTGVGNRSQINTDDNALYLHFCTMYCSFALAGHRGTCLRPLHIFALLLLCFISGRSVVSNHETHLGFVHQPISTNAVRGAIYYIILRASI